MEYEMMIPPFKYGKFADMKKKETQQYFEWYISQIQNRIEILKKHMEKDNFKSILDYSVDSLIPLWEWYEKKIEFVPKDVEEYEREISKYPYWMQSEISTTQVSFDTLKYGLDISMYFAEIIIKNSKGKIKWGYFTGPKKRVSVNEPTLLGFKGDMDLNPRLIILNCTRRSGKEKLNTRLLDVYNTWMSYVE